VNVFHTRATCVCGSRGAQRNQEKPVYDVTKRQHEAGRLQ